MSKLENLVRLSMKTFLQRPEGLNTVAAAGCSVGDTSYSVFQKSFTDLLTTVNGVTGDDVGISKLTQYTSQLRRHKPTALYSGVFDSPLLSICIFVLYPKSKIPLHSHPGMFGVLKVLHGDILIKSYSSLKKVDYSQPTVPNFQALETMTGMNEHSFPAVITPENNLHEIINQQNDNAVFLDILSPRYENENCYFATKDARDGKQGTYELYQVPCPSSFYTITVPFPLKSSISHLQDGPESKN